MRAPKILATWAAWPMRLAWASRRGLSWPSATPSSGASRRPSPRTQTSRGELFTGRGPSGSRPLYCPWPRFVDGPPSSAAFALRPSFAGIARGLGWGEYDYPRWGGHTSKSIATPSVLGAPASIMGSELPWLTGSGPLSWIETFVTFCGIVWLRAKVLGQMGWTTSPYLRAGALSCPSLAIDGPGSYGAPAFRFAAPPRPDALSPLPAALLVQLCPRTPHIIP